MILWKRFLLILVLLLVPVLSPAPAASPPEDLAEFKERVEQKRALAREQARKIEMTRRLAKEASKHELVVVRMRKNREGTEADRERAARNVRELYRMYHNSQKAVDAEIFSLFVELEKLMKELEKKTTALLEDANSALHYSRDFPKDPKLTRDALDETREAVKQAAAINKLGEEIKAIAHELRYGPDGTFHFFDYSVGQQIKEKDNQINGHFNLIERQYRQISSKQGIANERAVDATRPAPKTFTPVPYNPFRRPLFEFWERPLDPPVWQRLWFYLPDESRTSALQAFREGGATGVEQWVERNEDLNSRVADLFLDDATVARMNEFKKDQEDYSYWIKKLEDDRPQDPEELKSLLNRLKELEEKLGSGREQNEQVFNRMGEKILEFEKNQTPPGASAHEDRPSGLDPFEQAKQMLDQCPFDTCGADFFRADNLVETREVQREEIVLGNSQGGGGAGAGGGCQVGGGATCTTVTFTLNDASNGGQTSYFFGGVQLIANLKNASTTVSVSAASGSTQTYQFTCIAGVAPNRCFSSGNSVTGATCTPTIGGVIPPLAGPPPFGFTPGQSFTSTCTVN